ncbi:MAG: hypothetical protein ACLRZ7_06130 [Lachnospiraceae bacterium]
MEQGKKNIETAGLLFISFVVIIAITFVWGSSKNKADRLDLSTNQVETIIVVNNINNTTKTIDGSTQEANHVIVSLNQLKVVGTKDTLLDKAGEVVIYNKDKIEQEVVVYKNGMSINNKNYKIENFNFEEWYNEIPITGTPFERQT